jgi:hypothetical protein
MEMITDQMLRDPNLHPNTQRVKPDHRKDLQERARFGVRRQLGGNMKVFLQGGIGPGQPGSSGKYVMRDGHLVRV